MSLRTRHRFLAAALLLAGTATAASHHAEEARREMLALATKLEAGIEAQETRRPVLHGEIRPGLAFEAYERAVELLGPEASDDLLRIRIDCREMDAATWACHRDALSTSTRRPSRPSPREPTARTRGSSSLASAARTLPPHPAAHAHPHEPRRLQRRARPRRGSPGRGPRRPARRGPARS